MSSGNSEVNGIGVTSVDGQLADLARIDARSWKGPETAADAEAVLDYQIKYVDNILGRIEAQGNGDMELFRECLAGIKDELVLAKCKLEQSPGNYRFAIETFGRSQDQLDEILRGFNFAGETAEVENFNFAAMPQGVLVGPEDLLSMLKDRAGEAALKAAGLGASSGVAGEVGELPSDYSVSYLQSQGLEDLKALIDDPATPDAARGMLKDIYNRWVEMKARGDVKGVNKLIMEELGPVMQTFGLQMKNAALRLSISQELGKTPSDLYADFERGLITDAMLRDSPMLQLKLQEAIQNYNRFIMFMSEVSKEKHELSKGLIRNIGQA